MKVLDKRYNLPPLILFVFFRTQEENKGVFLKFCVLRGAWERHHIADVRHSGDEQQ